MTDQANPSNNGRRGFPWRPLIWGGAASLLLIPLVAMQFTDEVDWTLFDFAFAGGMIAAVGGVFELVVRLSDNLAYRAGVAVALGAMFLLVWINGAVGIIGSEDNPANLMFIGVIALAIAGAFVADFRAAGMARAMLTAAVAQGLVGTLAVAAGWGAEGGGWPQVVILASGVFVGLWLLSAWLFRWAARARAGAA